jgi:hypothetical protein
MMCGAAAVTSARAAGLGAVAAEATPVAPPSTSAAAAEASPADRQAGLI